MSKDDTGNSWNELRQSGMLTSDYSSYYKLCKQRARHLADLSIKRRKIIKLALLGSATYRIFLRDLLEFSLDTHGIGCEILEVPFNTYAYQMLAADSEVTEFVPDVIVLVNAPFNQPEWPDINTTDDEAVSMAEEDDALLAGSLRSS